MRHAPSLWELFGFRGWHDGDLASIDAEVLSLLIGESVRYESEQRRAAKS